MPFDGISLSPEFRVLDGLLNFFDDEDRWLKHATRDAYGRACLIGALRLVRHRLGVKGDASRLYLTRAICARHPRLGLIEFNDKFCSDFIEFRDTIRAARDLAALAGDFVEPQWFTDAGAKQLCLAL